MYCEICQQLPAFVFPDIPLLPVKSIPQPIPKSRENYNYNGMKKLISLTKYLNRIINVINRLSGKTKYLPRLVGKNLIIGTPQYNIAYYSLSNEIKFKNRELHILMSTQ